MFEVVMPYTGDAIATREPVIAELTLHLSIGFDLEMRLASTDHSGISSEARCLTS